MTGGEVGVMDNVMSYKHSNISKGERERPLKVSGSTPQCTCQIACLHAGHVQYVVYIGCIFARDGSSVQKLRHQREEGVREETGQSWQSHRETA